MDTAQRGMGLDWPHSLELIRAEPRRRQGLARRADRLGRRHRSSRPARRVTIDDVIGAYEEQCAAVEKLGGRIVLMASRALVKAARSPDDYATVYGRILDQVEASR